MTPKHTGLLNALLIKDYNIDSMTLNTSTHTEVNEDKNQTGRDEDTRRIRLKQKKNHYV